MIQNDVKKLTFKTNVVEEVQNVRLTYRWTSIQNHSKSL